MTFASNAPPDIDPADLDTLTGTFRFVVRKMLQDVNGMLPARIIAFDRTTNRVQVQPLIAVLTTNNTQVKRPQIASLPVLQIGGGGYMMNFNLNPGDLGWIQACDRDISLFLQSYSASPPATQRMADFGDSLFIPNIMTGYTIADEDQSQGNLVIQSLDSTVRIALWPNMVKITAPMGLVVDGPMTVTGLLNVNGGLTATGAESTPVNITGNVMLTGELAVVGDITATGDITPHV